MLSSPSVSERIQSARNEANKSRVALPPIPASREIKFQDYFSVFFLMKLGGKSIFFLY